MRIFVSTILLAATLIAANAGDIITATVIVSDADELTNNASITLGSDTRIWTNSVTTPATQIRSSTTEANAAFNLLNHFRAYPFADVQLQATNNGVVFIGEEGDALDLTITNAWATVAYRTNTVSSATVVRVPYTATASSLREDIANDLAAWLNLATDPFNLGSVTVNDDAYDADWNGSTNVPTKNAIYDKIETLSGGGGSGILQTLNTLSGTNQTFSVGTSGTDFAISSSGTNHAFNLPTASGSNRGALSSADWTTFNGKQGAITTAEQISDFLDLIDDTHGAILFRASGGWTNLPPGTSGKVLKSNGAAADPSWEDDDTGAPGSGDDVHVNGSDVTHPDFDDSATIEWSVSGTNVTAGVKNDSIALGTKTTGNYAAGDAEAGGATKITQGNTDATLSNAGEIHFNTADEQFSVHSAADGEISGEASLSFIQHRAWIFDPDAVCDGAVDRLFLMTVGDQAPEGIKIVEWKVSFEADPTTEADLDLKYADAFIGVANAAVIDVLDTTSGVSSEDTNANINSGNAIANGKVLYLEFGTAYTESNHQIIFEMWFYAEED